MKFLRPLLLILLSVAVSVPLFAQQNLTYNHFFLVPYLYNPSYIAPHGFGELNLNYRKQWVQFEGAPTTLSANLQLPLNHKIGLAANFFNDKAGILETNTALISFGYQVYLGKSVEQMHRIGFGLSAGYTNSRVDLSLADDPTDPSLLNGNTSGLEGNFGVNYQFKNLKIGFALPRLFNTTLIDDEGFNTPEFDRFNNTLSSISYVFNLTPRISIEPFFLYRTSEVVDSQFEVLGVLKFDQLLWVGGSYRQDYGPAAFLGFSLKEKIRVGYAYEFAPDIESGIGTGTHEFQLTVRLGKKQVSRPAPTTTAAVPVEEPVKQEEVLEKTEHQEVPVEVPAEVEKPKQEVPVVEPIVVPEVKPEEPKVVEEKLDLPPGYYVIVGAFKYSTNANKHAAELKANGFPATVIYSALRNFSYVYVGNFQTLEEARAVRDEYRAKSRFYFRDAWILSLTK